MFQVVCIVCQHLQGKHPNITGIHTDRLWLWWLAAYILDNTKNEHNREWSEQTDEIKNCKLIVSLVEKGEWDQVLYDNWDFTRYPGSD